MRQSFVRTLQWLGVKTTFVNLPMFALSSLGFVLLCFSSIGISASGLDFYVRTLGGIEIQNYAGSMPLLELGKWLLLLSLFLLNAGNYLENEVIALQSYTILRYRSRRRWGIHLLVNVVILAVLYVGSGFLITGILGRFLPAANAPAAILNLPVSAVRFFSMGMILVVHFVFLAVSLLFLTLMTGNHLYSFIATMLLEGGTLVWGILAVRLSKYMPGMWGMYLRSKDFSARDGFSPVVILCVQALLILIAAWGIMHRLKKD